eukprot:COSAG02_NODE_644_length_18993_cov_6.626389_7_plen_58_part_00
MPGLFCRGNPWEFPRVPTNTANYTLEYCDTNLFTVFLIHLVVTRCNYNELTFCNLYF